MVDARKSLQVLQHEWESCRACDLGVRRDAVKGKFVFGEGVRRGIMFIGEGPGEQEETEGRIFIESGRLIRDTLAKLQFNDYYLTNLVTCRSCETVIDPETGLPRLRKQFRGPAVPMLRDQPPLPLQIAACKARLYEEIYIVDPILIVSLGATVTEALLGGHVAITRDRGRTQHCTIPGATLRPVLTEKKQVWGRKVHGQYVMPTEQNMVQYIVLPTLHPSTILRKAGDMGLGSPVQLFGEDIRKAVKIYERYLLEGLSVDSTSLSNADLSMIAGDEYESENNT